MAQEGSASVPGDRHWFEDIADYLGPAYLRYSFTMGTDQEVGFLVEELGLNAGLDGTVLDVGCGPGRHAIALARLGIPVVGIDISRRFVELASDAAENEGLSHLATFHCGDAREMAGDPRFDGQGFAAAISLCQGAFGLGGPPDAQDPMNLAPDSAVLSGVRKSLRPGGVFAVSAFSSYFQVRWLEHQDTFSAGSAVNHEDTELIDLEANKTRAELWTTCYTPRELKMLIEQSGLRCDNVYSVSPGAYEPGQPTIDSHEFLAIGHSA